jgi:hypothetical protein
MTMAAASAPTITNCDVPVKTAATGNVTAAVSDPTEMSLVATTATANIAAAIPSGTGARSVNAPAAVATPFPPWNRSHTGYT